MNPTTSQDIINMPGAYLTGSMVIGGYTDDSDVDVVWPIDSPLPEQFLVGVKSEASVYNNGIKVYGVGRRPINIIRLHPLDYCAWMWATIVMSDARPITDRNLRHRAFEAQVLFFKTFVAQPSHYTLLGAFEFYKSHLIFKMRNYDEESTGRTV